MGGVDVQALIVELREHAKWSDMPICGTAADVIQGLVRDLEYAKLREQSLREFAMREP